VSYWFDKWKRKKRENDEFDEFFDEYDPEEEVYPRRSPRATTPKITYRNLVNSVLTDVYEEEDDIVILMHMPGVKEKDIAIRIEGRILEVFAKKYRGSYYRKVIILSNFDRSTMRKSYINGILEIRLKKIK